MAREKTMAKEKSNKRTILVTDFDYIVCLAVVILVLFGVTMVFSASYYSAGIRESYGMYYFFRKQATFAILGACAMIIMTSFNYRYLRNFCWLIYFVAVVGLLLVLIFGETINGAKRWINIPLFGSFQPSELAKLAVTLVFANMISADRNMFKTWEGFVKCGLVLALPILLVALGRNLSTILILGMIGGAIIFVASPYFWRYVGVAGAGIAGLVAYLAFGSGFRSERWDVFIDPFIDELGKGYQIIQSLLAVASGGLFGLGLGQSRQKLGYIPEPHNDIIFAIICEELGFVGASFVLLLFGVIVWRGLKIAMNATDIFGSLIATGITVHIGLQAVINVAVVTNTIPNTGIPMPFVSSGGTALLVCMTSMGILLNISRYSRKS